MYVRVGADSSPPSFGKVSNQLNTDLTELSTDLSNKIIMNTVSATTSASGNATLNIPSGYQLLFACVSTTTAVYLSTVTRFSGNWIIHITDANGTAQPSAEFAIIYCAYKL